MTRLSRFAVAILVFIVTAPILLFGLLYGAWLMVRPGPAEVSANAIPEHFPVLVFWRDADGTERCRPFFYSEIAAHKDKVGELSFTVPLSSEALCRKDFRGGWFEIRREANGLHEVHVSYRLGVDSDAPNDSWYTAREGSTVLENLRYQRYFGPAIGTAALIVATPAWILICVAYFIGAGVWVWRGKSRKAHTK